MRGISPLAALGRNDRKVAFVRNDRKVALGRNGLFSEDEGAEISFEGGEAAGVSRVEHH